MSENPEGSFTHKPLPTNKPQSVSEYTENANPKLKKFGKKIVNENYYNLLKIVVIIFGIGIIILGYAIYNDSFKTDIPPCPIIPSCPTCPDIKIPSCPTNNCAVTCGDIQFPSSFNVNLVNQTNQTS